MECPDCGHEGDEHSVTGCSAEGCPCLNTRDDVVAELASALGVEEEFLDEFGDEID